MNPGDTFSYSGPVWDVDAHGPEVIENGHMTCIHRYNDFIVAWVEGWDAKYEYVIPTRLGRVTGHRIA